MSNQATLSGEPAGDHESPFADESGDRDESPDESRDRPEPALTDYNNRSLSEYGN